MNFKAVLLDVAEVKTLITQQWIKNSKDNGLNDDDIIGIVLADTKLALNDGRYTHGVLNVDSGEYVALIGIVEAEAINCHKVLDIKLKPSSNPEYKEEFDCDYIDVSEDIVGSIVALTTEGIIEHGMKQVKIFARGHEMKSFFKLVVDQVKRNPHTRFLSLHTVRFLAGCRISRSVEMKSQSSQAEVLFKGLTKAFAHAFVEAKKQGINVKNLHWFKSEAEKNSLHHQEKRSA